MGKAYCVVDTKIDRVVVLLLYTVQATSLLCHCYYDSPFVTFVRAMEMHYIGEILPL